MKSDTPRFVPKLRLDNGTNKVFVPGKAELLKLIADTVSIRTAA
jgi:molybdenum-dependent DNA-binding transcriptional regulator ModE